MAAIEAVHGMHILFLTDNFPPEVNAPASRTFEHCREWVRQGEQVTVITCAPNFPAGRVFDGYRNRLWTRDEMDGIRVIRVWSYITANEGFVKRTLDYLSFMVSAVVASFGVRKMDVVVGTSPQFFTACAARVVGGLRGVPWVFELRDLWPESIRAVGALKDGKWFQWLARLEISLYKSSDRVVSVTNSFRENLVSRGIERGKIHVITNGVDAGRFAPMDKDAELVDELGLQGQFVAGYIGTHGMAHALETVLRCANRFKTDSEWSGVPIHFLMLGSGAQKQSLRELAAEWDLSNVTFLDTVPKEQVPRYWSLLDVSIIHLRKTPLFTTVIPSKLFESMGMGIPVLLGVEGESAGIVRSTECGLTMEPENDLEMATALRKLYLDEEMYGRLRQNGLKSAKQYDRKQLAIQMLEILKSLN